MNVTSRTRKHCRRGGGLVVALVTLLVVTSLMGSLIRSLLVEMRQSRHEAADLQAQWLAEAALDRAAAKLRSQADYAGETWNVDFSPTAANSGGSSGVVEIHIERGAEERPARVSVEARYPDDPRRRAKVERVWQIPSQKTKNSSASDARQEIIP
jgi:Tfp pilus assembly protein PilX